MRGGRGEEAVGLPVGGGEACKAIRRTKGCRCRTGCGHGSLIDSSSSQKKKLLFCYIEKVACTYSNPFLYKHTMHGTANAHTRPHRLAVPRILPVLSTRAHANRAWTVCLEGACPSRQTRPYRSGLVRGRSAAQCRPTWTCRVQWNGWLCCASSRHGV